MAEIAGIIRQGMSWVLLFQWSLFFWANIEKGSKTKHHNNFTRINK
jgi:hypothetical protein